MTKDRFFTKALVGSRHIMKFNPEEHDLEDLKKNYYEVDKLGDLLVKKKVKKAVKKPAAKTTKKAAKKTKK